MTDPADKKGVGKSPPVASIVIAAYNAAGTIERAIKSACTQSIPVEVMVVDDCSTDDTFAIASGLTESYPNLAVKRQDQNTGPAGARNTAIACTHAPWIAVLDSDDHMAPDRIEMLVGMAADSGDDFLADDLYRVSEDDIFATDNRLWSERDLGALDITFQSFVEGNLRKYGRRGELGFLKPLMRRDFLEAHNLGYDPKLRLAEDYILYAKALARGAKFRLIDPKGYYAVYRADSLSSRHTTKDLGGIVVADRMLAQEASLTQADKDALKQHRIEVHKEWAWRRLIDAVKARDLAELGRLVLQPPAVTASVAMRLLEQVWLRGSKRLRGGS